MRASGLIRPCVALGIFLLWCSIAAAGPLDPPGPPAPTFKTLDEAAPGIPIRQADLPITLNQPGVYYLASHLVWEGTGPAITIAADNVTLDFRGFTLDGLNPGLAADRRGIHQSAGSGAIIRNGTIRNMSGVGITVLNDATIEDMTIRLVDTFGISAGGNVTIRRCQISGVTDHATTVSSTVSSTVSGIQCASDAVIEDCRVQSINSSGAATSVAGILAGAGCRIHACKVFNVSGGNTALPIVQGIGVASASTVTDSLVELVTGSGAGSTIVTGIRSDQRGLIRGNTVHSLSGGAERRGIFGDTSRIEGNRVSIFEIGSPVVVLVGIRGSGSDITGNTVILRVGTNPDSSAIGVRPGGSCSVTSNSIVFENAPFSIVGPTLFGIAVFGSGNRVLENTVHLPIGDGASPPSSVRALQFGAGSILNFAGRNILCPGIGDAGSGNTLGAGANENVLY